jgi:NTP pyrophosphatase (non-canonical NTP hydrolase)
MRSFSDVRRHVKQFVREREWDQFHTPINLALALSGECGEVCEIFQWKGDLDEIDDYKLISNDNERVHIGEEVADVLIYSIRLSDVCGIDLPKNVRLFLDCKGDAVRFTESSKISNSEMNDTSGNLTSFANDWEDMTFFELTDRVHAINETYRFRSPRHAVLRMQSSAGDLCNMLARRSESTVAATAMRTWAAGDIAALSLSLAALCVSLAYLAERTSAGGRGGRDSSAESRLGACVADKLAKNARKYPVTLSRGSSAKYTALAAAVTRARRLQVLAAAAATAVIALAVAVGRRIV